MSVHDQQSGDPIADMRKVVSEMRDLMGESKALVLVHGIVSGAVGFEVYVVPEKDAWEFLGRQLLKHADAASDRQPAERETGGTDER